MIRIIIMTAVLVMGSAAQAQLWEDSFNHDPLGGSSTYNNGAYTELDENDVNGSLIWDSTIQDNSTGTYYDCDSIGMCHERF